MDKFAAKGIFNALMFLFAFAVEKADGDEETIEKIQQAYHILHTALSIFTDYAPYNLIEFQRGDDAEESSAEDSSHPVEPDLPLDTNEISW